MNIILNKKALAVAIATATLAACGGNDNDNDGNSATGAKVTRLATIPKGAELTGIEVSPNGEVFFNVQHPSDTLPNGENKAAVGAWIGIDIQNLPTDLEPVSVPDPASAEAMTTRVATGRFQVLGREGDDFAGGLPFGLGNIVSADGSTGIKQSNDPDFNAFITTGDNGNSGYLFTAWEDRPGGMSRMELSKVGDEWFVNNAMNIDFSNVNGTMINCFGSVSPWGTPLTSEENYEAENTAHWNDSNYSGGYPSYSDVQKIQDYLGGTFPNPYDYGYIVEITQPADASPVPVKHFTLGRVAHENPIIMPDEKTVYLTDDGGNKGFYKFVADTAGDLSSGTLYAAKATQDDETDSSIAGFDLEWIELGSSTNSVLEAAIDEYDDIDESDFVADANSYITDQQINDWAESKLGQDLDGMNGIATSPFSDDRVAFLETLKASEALGATVEFNKMEGININYQGAGDGSIPYMYVGLTDITGAMTDDAGDIQVSSNPCGIMYRLPLEADFDVSRMEPVLAGGPFDGSATGSQCSDDNISRPDNVYVLNDGRVLIGEDSSKHVNNMLWIYNPEGE
ncbi:MAG: alkaline phosphatase PhoX [Pseudomonadota bacterium]|uniref:PhoX family protein n=1 Tax=Alcanivorax sp. TaxID=1872427 RepID=UPI0025C2BC8F|nr:alkaline phosphatase PhoX [Alcanivorax sp.]MED5238417.1 alkaline phosphatase PhoX [Pseudomonadota bacterium]MEE3319588.1 alkaline phosphatase PhoX [Pseudomonadota bacterium]